MKKLCVFCVFMLISGCSVLAPQEDKIAKEVSRGIEDLCHEIDKSNRDRFIDKVNAELSGQQILVDCGD